MRQFGPVRYRTDALGRVVEKRIERDGFRPRTWRYEWDDDDRLIRLTEPDGTVWRYDYDPFGRRTRKLSAKGGHAFVWDGDSLAQDIPLPAASGDGGGVVTTWAWAADGFTPVAQLHGNTLAYAVTDHLGTPRELLAEDGTLAWAATYRVWGALNDNLHPAATAACPLRFPGQMADPESGLHYNRFRYYDPDTGQYLSPDPIGLFGGLRSWGYVHNPGGWIDPLGLAGCERHGKPPENKSPKGAGRRGAFREAKRQNGIPVTMEPSNVELNTDKRGNPQPGRKYTFSFDNPDGSKTDKVIRDDAAGHFFPDDPKQNRGPHFNDKAGNHYDY